MIISINKTFDLRIKFFSSSCILLICFITFLFDQAQSEEIQINSLKVNFDPNFKIAGARVISGYPIEGNLIIAQTEAGNSINLNNQKINLSEQGMFVIGFDRDSDINLNLEVISSKGEILTTNILPVQRDYQIERIQGIKKSMVQPPKDRLERIQKEINVVKNVRQIVLPMGDFPLGFDWPIVGRISGLFGSQRILNGIPKSPHYGIDIAAPKGTLIKAPASGIVTLVDNLYYSGLTVILNHGLGVNSTFLHLKSSILEVGDEVDRGELIGTVGSSGRSTGAHLDWRIDWLGKRLDAELLAGPMP